jgi:hypothetical protein
MVVVGTYRCRDEPQISPQLSRLQSGRVNPSLNQITLNEVVRSRAGNRQAPPLYIHRSRHTLVDVIPTLLFSLVAIIRR